MFILCFTNISEIIGYIYAVVSVFLISNNKINYLVNTKSCFFLIFTDSKDEFGKTR